MSIRKPDYHHSGYSGREQEILDELAGRIEREEGLTVDDIAERYGLWRPKAVIFSVVAAIEAMERRMAYERGLPRLRVIYPSDE